MTSRVSSGWSRYFHKKGGGAMTALKRGTIKPGAPGSVYDNSFLTQVVGLLSNWSFYSVLFTIKMCTTTLRPAVLHWSCWGKILIQK